MYWMMNTKQHGFSLLEVLIAFSILALSLGILLKIFSGGVNTAMVAEEYTTAIQLAESLMTRVGEDKPLVTGEESGIENETYTWRISISPYLFNPDHVDNDKLKIQVFQVHINISWAMGNGQEREFDLTSIKLAPQKAL
jgi:general secretion pathway protein I